MGVCEARLSCLLSRLDRKVENTSDVVITCLLYHYVRQFNTGTYHGHGSILNSLIQNSIKQFRTKFRFCFSIIQHIQTYKLGTENQQNQEKPEKLKKKLKYITVTKQ